VLLQMLYHRAHPGSHVLRAAPWLVFVSGFVQIVNIACQIEQGTVLSPPLGRKSAARRHWSPPSAKNYKIRFFFPPAAVQEQK